MSCILCICESPIVHLAFIEFLLHTSIVMRERREGKATVSLETSVYSERSCLEGANLKAELRCTDPGAETGVLRNSDVGPSC